jgi:hypothetical protein
MQTQIRVLKEVLLAPGEYDIKEQAPMIDFIIPNRGELVGRVFPIWDVTSPPVGSPVVVTYGERRSWRTLWRWKPFMRAYDGKCSYDISERVLGAPIITV